MVVVITYCPSLKTVLTTVLCTMANERSFPCEWCGKVCKSKSGLTQHQSLNPRCLAIQADRNADDDDDDSYTDVPLLARNPRHDEEEEDPSDDEDEEEDNEDTNDEENSDDEDDSVASRLNIISIQDDNSWGYGAIDDDDPFDFDNDEGVPADNEAKTAQLRFFREYAREIAMNHGVFDKYEKHSLELMYTLMKKGASLDTYDAVMAWHLAAIGDDNPLHFHSRHKMIKRLAKRYGFTSTFMEESKLKLPSSGALVNLITFNAGECVRSLLTDPRFGDEDYLHFDDDPLAPPPADLDYLEDINTGLAYTKTYQELIVDTGKQGKAILCPIILYIDGAVTGQFDKLSVEALKMTVGLFKQKAREEQYAWRWLGTFVLIPICTKQIYAYLVFRTS